MRTSRSIAPLGGARCPKPRARLIAVPCRRQSTSTSTSSNDPPLYGGPLSPLLTTRNTKVIYQGFTGRVASLNARESLAYGTQIVGGVSPNKSGKHLDLPLFSSVRDATAQLRPDATAIYVPAGTAAGAIAEAIEAEIPLIVAVAEHIPVHDTMRLAQMLATGSRSRLVGPNTPGLISPLHRCRIGFHPLPMYMPGHVAVVAKSGTLSYEAVGSLSRAGVGQSHCIGVGGDPVKGTGLVEAFLAVEADEETHAIVVMGEVGGVEERILADVIKGRKSGKPVVALVAGREIPDKLVMGHAGAFLGLTDPTGEAKYQALRDAGATMVEHPEDIGPVVKRLLESAPARPSTSSGKVPDGRRAFHTANRRPTTRSARVGGQGKRYLHLSGQSAEEVLSTSLEHIKIVPGATDTSCIPIGITLDRRSGRLAIWSQQSQGGLDSSPLPLDPGTTTIDPSLIRRLLEPRSTSPPPEADIALYQRTFQDLLTFTLAHDVLGLTATLHTSNSQPAISSPTIHIDDSAHRTAGRQSAIFEKYLSSSTTDTRSITALPHGIIYATLPSPDARIGTLVNGAGLAMNTLDRLRLAPYNAPCANFLDTGGKATAATVRASFELILSDPRVRVVFVNIFGGLTDCGMIAEGIALAFREVDMKGVPVVVRLRGTNEEVGQRKIAESGLGLEIFDSFAEAAGRVVEIAYPERKGEMDAK